MHKPGWGIRLLGADAVSISGSFNGTLRTYCLRGVVIVVAWMVAVTPGTGMAVPSHTPLVRLTGLRCGLWGWVTDTPSPQQQGRGSCQGSTKTAAFLTQNKSGVVQKQFLYESVWDSDAIGTHAPGRWRGCHAVCKWSPCFVRQQGQEGSGAQRCSCCWDWTRGQQITAP